jgi:hypothetical protein
MGHTGMPAVGICPGRVSRWPRPPGQARGRMSLKPAARARKDSSSSPVIAHTALNSAYSSGDACPVEKIRVIVTQVVRGGEVETRVPGHQHRHQVCRGPAATSSSWSSSTRADRSVPLRTAPYATWLRSAPSLPDTDHRRTGQRRSDPSGAARLPQPTQVAAVPVDDRLDEVADRARQGGGVAPASVPDRLYALLVPDRAIRADTGRSRPQGTTRASALLRQIAGEPVPVEVHLEDEAA